MGKYDAVINCIGLLNQFAENNKAMAILLNSYLPRYLVEVTKDTKTKVIHMSTDCVFAGNDGPYYEDTLPNGVTFTTVQRQWEKSTTTRISPFAILL